MEKSKIHVKKGDTGVVVSGSHKGEKGKVKAVLPSKQAVIVEGVNIIKKAVRPTPQRPQGGFSEQEAPLHASKVRPLCPSCGKPTRIRKKVLENGSKIRVCVHCEGSLDTQEKR